MVLVLTVVTTLSSQENPLERLSYYVGTQSIAKDDPLIQKRPELKDLKVIDFKWGSDRKVIHSRTGIYTEKDTIMFSEGIITYNSTNNKLLWLEFKLMETCCLWESINCQEKIKC